MGQDWTDKYSLLHLLSGFLAAGTRQFSYTQWIWAHAAFEILENTPDGMNMVNAFARAVWWPGGGKKRADTWSNMLGDQLWATLGFFLGDIVLNNWEIMTEEGMIYPFLNPFNPTYVGDNPTPEVVTAGYHRWRRGRSADARNVDQSEDTAFYPEMSTLGDAGWVQAETLAELGQADITAATRPMHAQTAAYSPTLAYTPTDITPEEQAEIDAAVAARLP